MGGGNGVGISNVFQKDLLFTNIETMEIYSSEKLIFEFEGN